jgi:predicted homoserine dehydrogenase-like protein
LYFVFKIQYCFQSVLSRNILGKTVNYKNLFKSTDVTRIGLIGTGAFGKSFLAQSRLTPNIRVAVVCDQDLETAEDACLQSGLAPEDLKVCHTESEANDTIASGKTAVISDALLLMDLSLEVVIEATGMPAVGAIHARSAIESGKHVVMVSKESDCVVGPILNRLAEKAGVVYTPADGDQPSLLIGLISWAETLGFEIVAMIFRPHHLLGVETATSVLAARYLKLSTGGTDLKPRVDVGLRAIRTLPQGYRLTMDSNHTIADVMPEILPAKKMASDSPIPYYMAAGNRLKHTVEEGKLLTYGMIAHDSQSCLWKLRQEQDTIFGM